MPNAVKSLPAIPTLPQIELLNSVALLPSTCKSPTTRLNEIPALFGAKQVVFGPLAGVAVGYVGAKLVARCHRRQWMSEGAEGMIALGLAFGAFALPEVVQGNGFIAAFVAGLTLGNTLKQKCLFLYEFAEEEGS